MNPIDIIDLQGPDLRMIARKQTFTMHVYNRDYESDILSNQKEVRLYRQVSAKTRLIGWHWHRTKTRNVPQIQRRIFILF